MIKITDYDSLNPIIGFPKTGDQSFMIERESPQGADEFFFELIGHTSSVIGTVNKDLALEDLHDLLKEIRPEKRQEDGFYQLWLADMAGICEKFCEMVGKDTIKFTLSAQRGCKRFHVDNVPFRLLVTYAGAGTEWINDHAANRTAFLNGAPNEDIITDQSQVKQMNSWDIAVFRGGPEGLLHRTPDIALKNKSVFMRLDVL